MVVPLDQRPRSGPYSGLTFRSARRFLARQFESAALPFADEDALDLLLGLTGLTRTDYTLRGTDFITEEQFHALQAAADQRLSGTPVDRILGWRDFFGRRFFIDNVLSPRGDSEVLLLAALDAVKDVAKPRLADLGTGSGALAITLLCERPEARAIATDISDDALTTAKRNAQALGVSDRLTLQRSDWLSALSHDPPHGPYDAILSNPPYIDEAAMAALPREVADHDPALALAGGPDGLAPYRLIIPGARDYLLPGGWLGVEIGFDQGETVSALFDAAGYQAVTLLRDPAGHPRCVHGRRPE